MARSKPEPKPLFALKGDFYDSLDHTLQQMVNFLQAVETALQLDQVSATMKPKLQEQCDRMRKALLTAD